MSSFLSGGTSASYGFYNLTALISWLVQGVFLWLNKRPSFFAQNKQVQLQDPQQRCRNLKYCCIVGVCFAIIWLLVYSVQSIFKACCHYTILMVTASFSNIFSTSGWLEAKGYCFSCSSSEAARLISSFILYKQHQDTSKLIQFLHVSKWCSWQLNHWRGA